MALEKSNVSFYFAIRTDSDESKSLSTIGISPAAKKATPVEAGAKLWQAEVKNATTASLITDALVQVLTGASGSNPTVAVYIPAGKAKEILNTQVEVKVYNGSKFSSVTVKINDASKIKSADASGGSIQQGPAEVTAARTETREEKKEKTVGGDTGAGDAGAGSDTSGAKEAPTIAQATPADTALEQTTLNNQARALTNTYAQARALANNPPEGVDPQFTAAMKYVLDSEISANPAGETWTAAHSQALREAAGLLLGNVSNPELQIFVRSYDAAMTVDITSEASGERFGITRTGAKALSAFVNANKDTAPQRGDAQYFLKDANNNDLKLVQQDPKSVLASAWALIFALRVRFRRGEVLGSIAASPSMRYPWPAERDTRNFSDSPAKDASVGPRLTLRVWTQADRDDKFDLGKSAVVLTFEADSSSFAKQIKELPSIFRLRTATRSREEAVRGKK